MAAITEPHARRLLDAVDNATRALSTFDAPAMQPPSVVVVGMQGSGKSSLLERITGIPFPLGGHDGPCTRVAFELSLRRCHESHTPSSQVFAHKTPLTDVVTKDKLEQAQSIALQGHAYDCRHKVYIVKSDHYLPEATLVDLPGLPYSMKHSSEEIDLLDMMRTYMDPEQSLICHVVPLNKPPDLVRTWDVVRQMDPSFDRTLTIFTMADQTDATIEVEYIHAHFVPPDLPVPIETCFVLEQDEAATETLHTILNEKMLQYVMDQTLPFLDNQIHKYLDICQSTLAKLEQQSFRLGLLMAREVHDVSQSIHTIFEGFLPELRASMERVVHDVLQWKITPFNTIMSTEDKKLDMDTFQALTTSSKLTMTATEISQLLDLVVEVKEMTFRSRGVANAPFHHARVPLQKWSEIFAKHTYDIMHIFVDELFCLFHEELETNIHNDQRYTDSMRKIGVQKLLKALQVTKDKAMHVVANIRDWNLGPDLYTTNSVALATASRMSEAEAQLVHAALVSPEIREKWGPHFEAYFHIRGYLRVQQHLVGDAMQREILRILRVYMADVEKCLHESMDEMLDETEKSRQEDEPKGRRGEWLRRQHDLYEAATSISPFLPAVTIVAGRDASEIKRRRMA
ncbi:hypothetical protein THRCLA_04977 [Thraustotheca clavata]|uniref:Dynamin GTPase domain-containing protein n=1 Tax=Thraustotheca clavata TaxID=74557 RepID=A0A1V9ZXA6_9STRA|nr:hypothetical protein THRCLA_04977 [Thraustotheca clavata]